MQEQVAEKKLELSLRNRGVEARKKSATQFGHRFLFLAACALVLGPLLSGCVKISGSLTSTKIVDFGATEILASGTTPADGASQMYVVIHLKNTDLTPVPGYKPEYAITGGPSVIATDCSQSDSDGISACVLRSLNPGTRNFVLTNAKKGLSKQIEFTLNSNSQILSLTTGSLMHATTSQGDKVLISIGEPIQGARTATTDGYTVKLSLQGAFAGKQ